MFFISGGAVSGVILELIKFVLSYYQLINWSNYFLHFKMSSRNFITQSTQVISCTKN